MRPTMFVREISRQKADVERCGIFDGQKLTPSDRD